MLINTHYYGPGMFRRGSCIFATRGGRYGIPKRQKTVPYDHALNAEENHKAAAVALFNRVEPGVPVRSVRVKEEAYSARTIEVLGDYSKETP